MLLSVICLTYNHAAYITACVRSLLNQTYRDWELVILDDGSTDGTPEVVKPFLSDGRIFYHRQENQGPAKLVVSYNRLLDLARGEVVTILEGDDYCEPDLLEQHRSSFTDPQVVLSYSQVLVLESWGRWISPQVPTSPEQWAILNNTPPGKAYNLLLKQCFIPAQGTSIRRTALKAIGGFVAVPGLRTVDYPTWLRLASHGTFKFIPKPLATWRRHSGQLTRQSIVPLTRVMVPVLHATLVSLPAEIAKEVKISPEELKRYWDKQQIIILIRGGRYKLMVGDWKAARHYYLESFTDWSFPVLTWRMRAVVGLICSYLHLNLEWFGFFSRINRYLKNRRT